MGYVLIRGDYGVETGRFGRTQKFAILKRPPTLLLGRADLMFQ
jgi:hypothetical protein